MDCSPPTQIIEQNLITQILVPSGPAISAVIRLEILISASTYFTFMIGTVTGLTISYYNPKMLKRAIFWKPFDFFLIFCKILQVAIT